MPRRRVSGPPHRTMLKAPDLRRWHSNVAQGSLITADVYLRRLGGFCGQMKVTPQSLSKLSEKNLRDLLLDFIAEEEKKGRAGSYIESTVKAVKSWMLHHGLRLTLPVKIKGTTATPTLAQERTPSQEELHRIFLASTSRDRVMCALMAHTGLRPEVMGNYLGIDGLRVQDLPELIIGKTGVEFSSIPAMVVVRPELSKAGHRYFTFLGEEGCGFVKDYLDERVRTGESIKPETDIVHPKTFGKTFIRTINIGDGVRQSIRKAGFNWRPYVLRAYFDTQLLLAESKGKVAHDYRVFWMGHKGSMEARYTTNKGRLPKELIDDMRSAYARCEPFLSTIPTKGAQDSQANIAKVMLMGLGYTDEELADKDLLDPQVFQQLVKEKMTSAEPKPKQRLVGEDELPKYLDEGWTVVAAFGDHRAVLNPPG
ncbi:MAG: site-specific integrase [Nitrososphaerota archaeon]|nr:site-specific integrase [Nitrososphaerota archaeon]